MSSQQRGRSPQTITETNFPSLLEIALFLLSFRIPMSISELMAFPSGWGTTAYYICPRCGVTLEREYQSFCDRCGQHLNWRGCGNVKVIKAPNAK